MGRFLMLRLACSILLPLSGWLWGSMVAPQISQAQWAQVDRDRLADEMEAAAENLDPDQFPTVADSLQNVRQQIQAVNEYFAEQADRENAAAWLRYLDLEPLIDAIASEESPALTASQAIDVGSRLIGTAPGLELPPLTDLRQGLIELTGAIRFRDSERTEKLLRQQLLALAERVRQMDDQLSADDAATLGAAARTLQFTGQAEGLVRSLQQRLGNPNVALLIGEPLVQTVISRSVHESRPVRECILGTRLVGT